MINRSVKSFRKHVVNCLLRNKTNKKKFYFKEGSYKFSYSFCFSYKFTIFYIFTRHLYSQKRTNCLQKVVLSVSLFGFGIFKLIYTSLVYRKWISICSRMHVCVAWTF